MAFATPHPRWVFSVIIGLLYFFIGHVVSRENTSQLLISFALLFVCTYGLIHQLNNKQLLLHGIAYRLLFLFSIPVLSPDFYRFIWDGLLLQQGINPYAFTPNQLMASPREIPFELAPFLYEKMGTLSASHFSNYPPLNQLGFWGATLLFPNQLLLIVFCIRMLIITADIATFRLGQKLLSLLGINPKRMGWYMLNPLVIIELTGNLHWEGIMLFFFALGCWYYFTKSERLSSLFFALSVLTKLIPLMLIPVYIRSQPLSKSLRMGGLGLATILLFGLPFFLSIGLENYMKTLQLWFKNFEFNGSIYSIIRALGFQIKGYNIIRQWGAISPLIVSGIVLFFSLRKKNTTPSQHFTAMMLILSWYYFIATVVHPWYIIPLVFLCLFTRYSYPLVWSAVVLVSYATYGNPNFTESPWLLAFEYCFVYGAFFYEWKKKRPLLEHF